MTIYKQDSLGVIQCQWWGICTAGPAGPPCIGVATDLFCPTQALGKVSLQPLTTTLDLPLGAPLGAPKRTRRELALAATVGSLVGIPFEVPLRTRLRSKQTVVSSLERHAGAEATTIKSVDATASCEADGGAPVDVQSDFVAAQSGGPLKGEPCDGGPLKRIRGCGTENFERNWFLSSVSEGSDVAAACSSREHAVPKDCNGASHAGVQGRVSSSSTVKPLVASRFNERPLSGSQVHALAAVKVELPLARQCDDGSGIVESRGFVLEGAASQVQEQVPWQGMSHARIVHIELEDFKVFKQKVVSFENDPALCVVGPNSIGKSSIVDAIRFLLLQHTDQNLGDLIRRSAPPCLASRVTAHFECAGNGIAVLQREVRRTGTSRCDSTFWVRARGPTLQQVSKEVYTAWISSALCWADRDLSLPQFSLLEKCSATHLIDSLPKVRVLPC
jgi:hypothetical protein